ncbi:MAG: hypothetical protein WC208_16070 [Gallionella sp.]|jgi:hypothetical protein
MAYAKAIKEQAKALYIANVVPVEEIARELKIGRQETIWDWAKKYGWKQAKNDVAVNSKTQMETKIVEKAVEKAFEWVETQDKVGRLLISKGVQKIQATDPNTIDVSEARMLVKDGSDIQRKAWTLGKEDKTTVVVNNLIGIWNDLSEGELDAHEGTADSSAP